MRLIYSLQLACWMIFSASINGQILQIKPGAHYFSDRKGKPFLWVGDTQWELFHLLPVDDAKHLLLERKKQGFNTIQIMATGVFREWGVMKNLPRDTTREAWIDDDPLQPNEQYFRRMDSIVKYAATIDMILVVGVYHAQDEEHKRITPGNARKWARWLTSRYNKSPNIIWSMYPHANDSAKLILNEVIKGIGESGADRHLITVHPDPSPKSSSYFMPATWLSFNTLQTWNSGIINYSMVISDYFKQPVMPVVNGEARYEGEDGTTEDDTRRAGYFSMLAGGFYTYGHQDNWRSPTTWRNWYRSPGAGQMIIMKNIFDKIGWWKLVPDSTLLKNQCEGCVAARSSDNLFVIAYLSSTQNIQLHDSLIRDSEAVWINPQDGKEIKIDHELFVPPRWKDAILLIRRKR